MLTPIIPIQILKLHRLRYMLRSHIRRMGQIRTRPRHSQKPVMRPRRQIHPPHRHLQRPFTCFIQLANRPKMRWRNVRIIRFLSGRTCRAASTRARISAEEVPTV